MTNEQRYKTINFILEQQAKLTSDLQQLAEAAVVWKALLLPSSI